MSLNSAHEGYDYQDLITSYFILKEILAGNTGSLFSIDKKHTQDSEDRFDDLVITNNTRIQRKQVKYSNDTTAKKLLKDDLAADSNYKLALYKLYGTWKELNTANSEFRLCLAWDEPTDDNIKNVLTPIDTSFSSFSDCPTKLYKINLDNLWEESPEKFNRWNSLKNYVQENNIDRTDFKNFCDELIIELELPKASLNFSAPSTLETILYGQAEKLGIAQYPNDDIDINRFLIILAKKVSEYRTKSAEISGFDILNDLKVKTDFGRIEQKFDIDQTKNIKDDDKYSALHLQVVENKKIILIGEPGSGKSWFLTNYIDYLHNTSKAVIRHYCFTSTEDEFSEKRISSDVFFGNLIADIIKKFPSLQKKKEKVFASDLDELNLLLSHIETELLIIIDGLDHIDRVLKNSSTLAEDKTKIIEYISKINLPENIFIILGSQPVSEIRILIDHHSYTEVNIPKWNIDDTINLMDKYSLEDCQLDEKFLSELIFEKSEASPLYLTYIIKTLLHNSVSLEAIEKLPQYDFNLKNYYDYLTAKIENNITSEILSCLEFTVSEKELSELIDPWSHHLDSDLKVLSPVIMKNYSRGGIKLYHDSFRRFNIEKLSENANIDRMYEIIARWLENQNFYQNAKSYRHLLKYYIKTTKFDKVKEYATNDFLTKSLYNGYPDSIIKINYNHFLYVAKETLDWPFYAYISELNKTIFTTISEDYQNGFIEHFEEFFEAVGLIYGFNRANEMLFYDGEKNFSDEIIAKSFYISQIHGFTPVWKHLEAYFDGKKRHDKFKYYIHYLASIDSIDDFIETELEKLVLDEYNDFFHIFIEEIYYIFGFEKILLISDQSNQNINDKINNVLSSINADRFLIANCSASPTPSLPPLDLSFTDHYIDDNTLESFIETIYKYAKYDIDTLISFNESISPKNFFFNWMKFIINQCIIEYKMDSNVYANYGQVEKDIIDNLIMLSNDVEPFKGRPRAIDLTRNSHLLIESLDRALQYLRSSESWQRAIDSLQLISFGTMGYLNSMQMGVLAYGKLIDLLLNYLNEQTEKYILDVIENVDTRDETYSYHLEYKLKKAITYSRLNEKEKAKNALKQAVSLITSYTYRKDRTLSEVIEPLNSINRLDHALATHYAKELKYLTDAVMKHTEDGKDTRWLTIEWFEKFLEVDYRLSSMYLIHQFIHNEYFWKLDYMFVDYIQASKEINPVILNFLHRLSPTNAKDEFINSFLDNIYTLLEIDKKLSEQSLMSVLNRDLNNSYDSLTDKTSQKIQVLKQHLNITKPIKQKKDEKDFLKQNKDSFSEQVNKSHTINNFSLAGKELKEINEYFEKKDDLTTQELNSLFFFLLEKNDDELSKRIFTPLIQKRYSRSDDFYEDIRGFINHLTLSDTAKVHLLIQTFVHSKSGWFEPFINIEALRNALSIDEGQALSTLALALQKFFSNFGYSSASTANLIIAFEAVGLEKNDILSMYKNSFEFFKYRLPDVNDFVWTDVEDEQIENMTNDELAIVMILSKMKNYDSLVQKEILSALNYLLNYNEDILVKPMQWFFENIHYFPHISISAIIDLFKLHIDKKRDFIALIFPDMQKVSSLQNQYIENTLNEITEQINYV